MNGFLLGKSAIQQEKIQLLSRVIKPCLKGKLSISPKYILKHMQFLYIHYTSIKLKKVNNLFQGIK